MRGDPLASVFPRGSGLASPLWLVGCKVALALGELLGVPVALALAESLAGARSKGLTLGLSYVAHALGFWLGGELGALWPSCSHAAFFAILAGGCTAAAAAAAAVHSQSARLTGALAVQR
jgi:POT family proton-dependent oligopeptide transporter